MLPSFVGFVRTVIVFQILYMIKYNVKFKNVKKFPDIIFSVKCAVQLRK